uniref:Uncharacterized protein n=1 Tax=Helianthus annuus TaxID=4232 RepID=A0A251TT81_HELAN
MLRLRKRGSRIHPFVRDFSIGATGRTIRFTFTSSAGVVYLHIVRWNIESVSCQKQPLLLVLLIVSHQEGCRNRLINFRNYWTGVSSDLAFRFGGAPAASVTISLFHMCTDYRELSKVTVKNHSPRPCIDNLLASCKG